MSPRYYRLCVKRNGYWHEVARIGKSLAVSRDNAILLLGSWNELDAIFGMGNWSVTTDLSLDFVTCVTSDIN